MRQFKSFVFISAIFFMSCNNQAVTESEKKPVQIVTLDPGHFHAALVQKSMYPDVDSVVQVYAPEGNDLQYHLDRIKTYNSRADNATQWKENVYTGNDFFEKMIAEKKGNVVVLSGNNQKKSEYILQSLQNGFNVLADKPMVIESNNFSVLQQAFETAKEKGMTTIAFTGMTGGQIKSVSDHLINIPSTDTPRIQESHITVGHIICQLVEEKIFDTP